MSNITIRKAVETDATLILSFIKMIAEYENMSEQVTATEEIIYNSFFGKGSVANCFFAEIEGKPVAYAVYFYNFSTFTGKKGLYLEDIFVLPEHRGSGVGKKLMKHLSKTALNEDCGRFEWVVLDWNTPAIKVYDSIGAKPQNEWILYRMGPSEMKEFIS